MKKTSKKQKQQQEQLNKLKETLTVNVIQYNHIIQRLKKNILQSMNQCQKSSGQLFQNQRELSARKRMTNRVLNSTLKMLDNNKLQLWMIDEQELRRGIK